MLLYFSSAPVLPSSIDHEQWQRLQEYKQSLQGEGLFWHYSSVDELRASVDRHLVETVNQFGTTSAPTVANTPDNGNELYEALLSIVRRAQINWEAERDSEPVPVDEAKYIIQRLADNLVEFLVAAQDNIDQEVVRRLREALTEARDIQRHRMFIDGGASYREFWTRGDALLADLMGTTQSLAT